MKKYRYLILALSIAVMAGLTLALWKPMVNFIQDPDTLSLWIAEAGILGPIVFMLLNTAQVLLAILKLKEEDVATILNLANMYVSVDDFEKARMLLYKVECLG